MKICRSGRFGARCMLWTQSVIVSSWASSAVDVGTFPCFRGARTCRRRRATKTPTAESRGRSSTGLRATLRWSACTCACAGAPLGPCRLLPERWSISQSSRLRRGSRRARRCHPRRGARRLRRHDRPEPLERRSAFSGSLTPFACSPLGREIVRVEDLRSVEAEVTHANEPVRSSRVANSTGSPANARRRRQMARRRRLRARTGPSSSPPEAASSHPPEIAGSTCSRSDRRPPCLPVRSPCSRRR